MEFDGFSAAFKGGSWMARFAGRRMSPGTVLLVPSEDLGPFAQILGATAGRARLAPAKPLRPETPTENAVAVVEAFTDQG